MNLTVYVSEGCWGCQQAREIAAEMGQSYSELEIELIDVDGPEVETPEAIFATPTYVLDGQIVSLGNPKPETLRELIEAELESNL